MHWKKSDNQARERALKVLAVMGRRKTAKEAAMELGISRQAFHQWQKRALQGLLGAMEEKPAGRPENPRSTRELELEQQVQELKTQLHVAEEVAQLRGNLLRNAEELALGTMNSTKKKKTESDRS